MNGEKRAVPENFSLIELLRYLQMPSERIAVELNGTVARKKDWENLVVRSSDRLEVVHFVGGG